MKDNLVIKASAGTGKTFALATRFIKLMVFRNVRPETILALTFSRAAAQEIYEKILNRLRDAASSDAKAVRERDENLLKDILEKKEKKIPLSKDEEDELRFIPDGGWTAKMFSGVLRLLIDAQGHDTIATLDSFILRIVRKFPLETGFAHALSVQDNYGDAQAKSKALAELLSTTSGDADVIREFFASQDDEAVRSGTSKLGYVVRQWLGFLLENENADSWKANSMRDTLGVPAVPQKPTLPAFALGNKETKIIDKIRDFVEAFQGDKDPIPENNAGKVLRFFRSNPDSSVYEFDSGEKRITHYKFDVGPDGAAALRAAAQYLFDVAMNRRIEIAAARIALCARIKRKYQERTFGKGLLTFSDFTRSLAKCENSERKLDLQNLQFRLDSKFDHWSLDEFQDTSNDQWKCLRPLVQEAVSGEGRSVLAVGDLKQSIYGWRGGDDGPFLDLMDQVGKDAVEELPISHRYGWNTARFVDAVFGPDNIRGFAGSMCPKAVEKWTGEACWPKDGHKAKEGNDGDFVEIIQVAESAAGEDGDGEDDGAEGEKPGKAIKLLAPAICARAMELWAAHEAANSQDTIGILVRTNKDGLFLAEKLRTADWPDGTRPEIVWEGESAVLDAPVVRALLQLLRLADHPEDNFAWACVNQLFPIRERIFPDLDSPAKVSRAVAKKMSRLGLSRTLCAFAAKLKENNDLDPRSRDRLAKLVREAVVFEGRPEAAEGTASFASYLESVRDRDLAASPDVIRILTIHRSKGLSLGHVIVPVAETDRSDEMTQPKFNGIISGEGWAFESIPEQLANEYPALLAARQDAANDHFLEVLRTYYVAATRAERSTHFLILGNIPENKKLFRNLLIRPFVESKPCEWRFGTVLHSSGTAPSFLNKKETDAGQDPATPLHWTDGFGTKRSVRHEKPSTVGSAHPHSEHWRTIADLLDEDFGSSARHGTDEHAEFAKIEWIDPTNPKDDREKIILDWGGAWREAFRETPGATVWRERSYELFDQDKNVWETGQFDRVVFRVEDGKRKAGIYDFKTNANREKTPEAFEEKMRETYAGQMADYRRAVARLTGIPEADITATLLLTSTGTTVENVIVV